MKKLQWAFILAILGAAGLCADPVRQGLYLDQNLQAACNPLGVQLGTKLFYRLPLVKKKGVLWESTKIDAGIVNTLSPAYDMAGGFVDIQPIAFFDLSLSAQFAGYFSALGYGFHDLAGYDSAFDETALNALPAKDTGGYLLSAAPTLQFAAGPIVAVDTFTLNYFNVDGGRGYFYETIANCALAKNGVELANQAYLLARLGPALMVGLNDSLLHIPASGYESHALHLMGIFTKDFNERASLYSALMLGVYLSDRYDRYEPHAAGQVGVTLAL